MPPIMEILRETSLTSMAEIEYNDDKKTRKQKVNH